MRKRREKESDRERRKKERERRTERKTKNTAAKKCLMRCYRSYSLLILGVKNANEKAKGGALSVQAQFVQSVPQKKKTNSSLLCQNTV